MKAGLTEMRRSLIMVTESPNKEKEAGLISATFSDPPTWIVLGSRCARHMHTHTHCPASNINMHSQACVGFCPHRHNECLLQCNAAEMWHHSSEDSSFHLETLTNSQALHAVYFKAIASARARVCVEETRNRFSSV